MPPTVFLKDYKLKRNFFFLFKKEWGRGGKGGGLNQDVRHPLGCLESEAVRAG